MTENIFHFMNCQA